MLHTVTNVNTLGSKLCIVSGYFNSTLNPVIYAMTNRDFKLAFVGILKKIFCFCCSVSHNLSHKTKLTTSFYFRMKTEETVISKK